MLNDQKPEYWIEIANHDIDTVNILLKESDYPDIIIYHIHQVTEAFNSFIKVLNFLKINFK